MGDRRPTPSTFSIVAFDPATGDLGVAVQSKFLAVGAYVPSARAGVGAIATQAYSNLSYGPRGLELLAQGLSAPEVVERLLADDPLREQRQLGIVDARGQAAAFTGKECFSWAGHLVGQGYCCQGNILVGEETVQAMAETFQRAQGELAERLLAALTAGQEAGGDRRGQQSAALLVVRASGGYGGTSDRYIDLRVDDHPRPIEELRRLLHLHRIYFQKPRPEDLLPLEGDLLERVREHLARLGYRTGPAGSPLDDLTRQALFEFAGLENLEERLVPGPRIDPVVLEFLERKGRPE
ncbi:MAG: DUF1028 domain-containing protein [Chloroflexia bacterium]